MSLIYRFRGRFDEAFRIRHGWGLSPLRSQRELRALVAFCEGELKDKKHMKLNLAMWDIYKETVRLYKTNDPELYYYITNHADWYWS